ncbi:HD domain-containing protein [Streptomyces sp. NPDC056670]|uniref:HD domain-containing protein n=1 Tax=Streptomyces sp. NPDC056670 TaxID=3345904 RepID=UPI0036A59A84
MADDSAQGTTSFIAEMGVLNRVARTGWWFKGNKAPETAEHSFRVGVIGSVLAMMDNVDPARVALAFITPGNRFARMRIRHGSSDTGQ